MALSFVCSPGDNNTMRLLSVADAIFEDLPGGSRVAARELAKQVISQGHEATFLVGRMAPDLRDEEVMPDGRRVIRYDGVGKWPDYIREGKRAAARLFRASGFDIVHVHFAYSAVGPLQAIPHQIPRVRTFHGPWDEEGLVEHTASHDGILRKLKSAIRARYSRSIEQSSLAGASSIITLSDCFRDKVNDRYGIGLDKVSVIPGGVDIERFTPCDDKTGVRHELGLPTDRRILLSIRRLAPRMGLDNLIAAMPSIVARNPNVLLLIGGKGTQKQRLEQLIAELGLDQHVRLLGYIPDSSLAAYYQCADLFVLPTIALEGFGLVTIEALASGVPVIGTPVGATPEILARINPKLVCGSTDPTDLAKAIDSFLNDNWATTLTPERLHRHAREHYSWTRHAQKTEAIYNSLIESRARDVMRSCAEPN